jgi:hypothetical protein
MEAFVFFRLLKTAASFGLSLNTFSTYPQRVACDAFYACGLAGRPL